MIRKKVAIKKTNMVALATKMILTLLQISLMKCSPFSESINTYSIYANGTIALTYQHVGGQLDLAKCTMYCGCLSFSFAGHSNDLCYCGNNPGTTCDSNFCMDKIDTSGIVSTFATPVVNHAERFKDISIDITQVAGIKKYGVVIDDRLMEFSTRQPLMSFVEPGNHSIVVEPGAFVGCQSESHTITVHVSPNFSISCDKYVIHGKEFECDIQTFGTDLNQLTLYKNDEELFTIDSISEPYYYSIGGKMQTNRYEEYFQSYSWNGNKTHSAFINPSHEFHTEGVVKAFEAHITRLDEAVGYSCINFMIVKPKCVGSRYCFQERVCGKIKKYGCEDGKDDDDPIDYSIYYSQNHKLWCMEQYKFINSWHFNSLPMEMLEQVGAYYQIEYTFQGYAYHLGNNVFNVSSDKEFTVKPGYFLGWHPCLENPADVGYYGIDPPEDEIYSEYEYQNISHIAVLGQFSLDEEFAQVSHNEHMVRAHVEAEAHFKENFAADEVVGTEIKIKASLSSKYHNMVLEAMDLTIVTEEIENLTITAEEQAEVNKPLSVHFNVEKGHDIVYCINWGNGMESTNCMLTTTSPTVEYTYNMCGAYIIYVEAYNTLTKVNARKSVNIVSVNQSIEFLNKFHPIPAQQTGDRLTVDVVVFGSGENDIMAMYAHANGSIQNITFNATVSQYFIVNFEKSFYTAEDIYVTLTIKNKLMNMTIGSYGSIEDPVIDFELDTNLTAATHNQTLLQIYDHQGTNVTYIWQLNEFKNVTTSSREINHTFSSYGNKTINITAYNKVSQVNLSFIYEVQDTIFGLELIGETHIFTEFTKPSIILFKLNEGTGVECWINYNTTDTLLSPVAHDLDIVNDSSYLIAYGNYTYLEKGIYNVSVYCENDVSNISLSHLMPVEDKITDFVTEFHQTYEGDLQYENDGFYDWVEVNETVNVTVSVSNEGEVWFVYDAGDGRPNVTTTNLSHTFSYPEWSDKLYVMVITAFNRVDRVNHTNYTWVPRPVENMTGFDILHDPENSTEKMELKLVIETGDFFNCSWAFGDGSETEYVTYDTFLENGGVVLHQFAADENLMVPGVYNVSVNCSNRLYTDNASAIVQSYNPVSNFIIELFSECEGENRTEGFGLRGDLFPIECDVIFVVSEQEGTNVSYWFDFGYINETTGEAVTSLEYDPVKPLEETQHRFKPSREPKDSKWILSVKIFVKNRVSWLEKKVNVQVISSILSFTVNGDEKEVFVGAPANIYFLVPSIGYEGCYVIDMGDGKLPVIFGHQACANKIEYLAYKYLSTVNVKPLKSLKVYTHIYDVEDLYTVTVTGVNLVSEFQATITVNVIDFPCSPPNLWWASAMAKKVELANTTAPFFKCRRYVVLTKGIPNCMKPNTTIERTWSLQRVRDKEDRVVNGPMIEIPEGSVRYVIDARSLEYGTYHIQLNGSMFHNESGRFVPETLTILDGYFFIKQCPLFPLIVGGTGIAVGHNGTLVMNGSTSFDPDITPGFPMNLKFKWFCKRRSEVFPKFEILQTMKVTYPSTPFIATTNHTLDRSGFHGCFGTGVGRLDGNDLTGSTIILKKKYMLYKEFYDIWMHISQDGRKDTAMIKYNLNILESDPPIVSIKCKLNCLMKKNPTQKTSLIAKCDNCGHKPAIYKWDMFALNLSAPDSPFINATHNLSMCASTNIESEKNLVMPAYTLETVQCLHIGFQYVVVLRTFWGNDSSKISEDQGGFAQYTIDVNEPPDITNAKAKVMVLLENGTRIIESHNSLQPHFALETRFVVEVTGVEDDDLPLSYNYFYLPTHGNHSGQWKSAIFPSEGSPISEPFTLPAGSNDNDYLIRIRVTVSDTFLSTSEGFYVEVPVQPKVLTMDLIRAKLKDPKIRYDSAALGNLFGGLLDSLGDPSSTLPNDEVKMLMTEMLPMIEIDSAATVAMVASVLDGASDDKEEPLSEEQLANSVETTKKMAQFSSELTPEQLEKITKQTLAASAKFTGVLSGNNSADNLKAAMENEALMTSGSSSNMISGETPTPMKTANGQTQVLCVQGAGAVGGFKLPDLRDNEDEECSGTTISDNTKNRYSFADEGVSAVFGNTMGLSLTGGMGKSKKIADLKEPIRLTIPHKGIIPAPTTHNAYCELMRIVHLVECNTNETNLILKVRPSFDNFTGNFFVFLNKGTAPSLIDHEVNCTLPNPYPDNWDDMTDPERSHFEDEEKWRCLIEKEIMNNLCTGRWCAGVVYFTNSTNRTTILKDRNFPIEEAKCTKVNYTFIAYSRACLWWYEERKNWAGAGCNISRETKDNETICYCDHLTDFGGGGPFPEPNPIDFGAAFSGFNNLGENPTVFSTVMGIFGLFLILWVWAKRKDRADIKKRWVCRLSDNHPNDTYFYKVAVKTGNKSGASSTADVYIVITGTEGETAPRKLNSNARKFFQKGEVDTFLLAVPFSLGKLFEIRVFHNNTGLSPGWYLAQVEIQDIQTKKSWSFVANQWLDITEDDGEISRTIPLPDPDDFREFSYVFGEVLQRNLYDGHIWLSLFTKLPQSSYTRVQRLCTCLSLLLTNMVTNAMFFEADQGGPPPFLVTLGPFIISLQQVKVAITSALIIIPAHLLIVTFFKKSGSKVKREESFKVDAVVAEEPDIPEVITEKNNVDDGKTKEKARVGHNRRIEFLRSILFPGTIDNESRNPLPYWLKYIAYFFVFATSVVSALFMILYGFAFGQEKSIKWLTSFLLSFGISIFLLQPAKVLVLSLLFALVVKEPPNIVAAVEKYGTRKQTLEGFVDEELESEVQELVKLPDAKRLKEIKEQRIKEKIIKAIVKEILTQSLFVLLCIFVCYAAVDPNAYYLGESVHKLMGENGITGAYFGGKAYMLDDIEPDGKSFRDVKPASEISNRLEWFDWSRYSVVEYLFMNNWYNKDKYALGYIADNQQSKILAMARFRQNRIKKMSCTKHPVFEHLIVECNAGYSAAAEQTKSFSKGWEPAFNHSTKMAARKGLRKALYLGYEDPWRFQTSSELKNFPYWGQYATYGGDSYSVSIGPKKRVAKKVMKEMKDNFWVDRYTRAIFTEANIYNAHTNLLVVVTFLHEILPTGGWSCMVNIQPLRLYRYVGGFGEWTMLFDIIFVIVTLVGLYKIIRSCRREGIMVYLSGFWNILHTIITFCSLLAIALTFGRFFAVKNAIFQYLEEPELFVSFGSVTQLENLTSAFLGFTLFFANLEFLRILRFNKSIGNMTKTMKILGSPLASFGMTFIIIFMAYVSFTHCMFADKLENFRDLKQSFVALTMMFMGSFDIYSYLDNAPILGPIMFFSYMMAIQMIMINMFVGIICDAFAEVGEMEPEEQPSVLSFMANRVKNPNGSSEEPVYSDWKDEWELMIDLFNDQSDHCLFLLQNFEKEELRHAKWFEMANGDGKRDDGLTAVLGSDFLEDDSEFIDGLSELQHKLNTMSPGQAKIFLRAAAIRRQHEKEEAWSNDSSLDSSSGEENESNGAD